MKFINLTPHVIVLNDGTTLNSEGVARVSATFSEPDAFGIMEQVFGEITGLPTETPAGEIRYVVSSIVLQAAKSAGRTDCVAPATGHPDTVRNDKGHIISVPGFVV